MWILKCRVKTLKQTIFYSFRENELLHRSGEMQNGGNAI